MKDQWYCRVEGQQYGPYTWDQMRAMVAEGRLVAASYVRREVDQKWFAAEKIPGLIGSTNGPPAGARPTATALVGKAMPESTSGPDVTSTVVPKAASGSAGQVTVKRKPKASVPPQPPMPPPLPNRSEKAIVPPSNAPPPVPPKVAAASSKTPSPPIPRPADVELPLGIVVAPPVAAPSKASDADAPPGMSRLTLAIAAVAALVVLLVVGGVVAVWQMSRSRAAETEVASKAEATKDVPVKPLISDAELDAILGTSTSKSGEPPAKLDGAKSEAAKPDKAKASDVSNAKDSAVSTLAPPPTASPPDPQVEAAKKLLADQKDWRPVEAFFVSNRSQTVRMDIAGVWLAKDALGIPVAPPQSDEEASEAKYVFVEIRVTNTGDIPRKYTSWNTGDATEVILSDDTNQPLPLVPASETPHAVRQTALQIPPGHLIRDVLVFRAPSKSFHTLRLLLAQSVFAPGLRGYFPLEASAQALLDEPPPVPMADLAADGTEVAQPPDPAAPIPVPPRDPNAPVPLDVFTEQLGEDAKMRARRNGDSPQN